MTEISHRDDGAAKARRRWMAVLARADAATLEGALAEAGGAPAYRRLKGPEIGAVMVEGRAGGGGRRFNVGEATVTRCAIRLEAGGSGVGYVLGRDPRKAEAAAVLDALLQDPAHAPRLMAGLIEPLEKAQAEARELASRKAAATRVDFFTMVRGA